MFSRFCQGCAGPVLALVVMWIAPSRAGAEAMLQLFNLSWNEVSSKLPEIAEAGYTSLWLPPPTKGGSGYSIGYDLWDPFDLGDRNQRGTVATRYGTREELVRMVEMAHRFGLRVYFDNIMDADPNNDDANTGFKNGNGPGAWAAASAVTPSASLNSRFPGQPREFRFTYFAVPASGTATLTVRILEYTSSTFTDRHRTLVRTVNCAAPMQTLRVAFPSFDGQTLSLPQDGSYTVVARFTETLTADPDLFTVTIDGSVQERSNAQGAAAYVIQDQTPGDGFNELRFDWRGMSPGQHLIEVNYTGDGLALEATRLVRVQLSGVSDTDGDGLPDFWEEQNGLNPTNAAGVNGPGGDPDGDDFSNLEEYLAGTDPQDGASLLRITELAGAGRVIAWQAIPGRNYQVFATTNINTLFQPLSPTLTSFGGTMCFTNSSPVRPREFYRVRALP